MEFTIQNFDLVKMKVMLNKSIIYIFLILIGLFSWSCRKSTQPENVRTPDQSYDPSIIPENFIDVPKNPYLPVIPGTILRYTGTDKEKIETIEIHVTHATKTILGITCIGASEQVLSGGNPVEMTISWYAQDQDGNVWQFGEETEELNNGQVISTDGTWEAGVDGAKPGIVMRQNPQPGAPYRQEYYFNNAEDMGQVVDILESLATGIGVFNNVIKVKEWTELEPGLEEYKYYAPNVGLILEEVVKGGSGRIEITEYSFPEQFRNDSLDYQLITSFEPKKLKEPSGIIYHESRATLFIVGDRGDIDEVATDGTFLNHKNIDHADFEGITYNPVTGLLYVVIEGEGKILEINPDDLSVLREFSIDWFYNGRNVLDAKKDNIESITFKPDGANINGGTFFIADKNDDLQATKNPSMILELNVPLTEQNTTGNTAFIVEMLSPEIITITDLYYASGSQSLYVVSDSSNLVYQTNLSGNIKQTYKIPGEKQEGITIDQDQNFYISDDTGPIFIIRYQ
jgi:uncharacterized protein YjiK